MPVTLVAKCSGETIDFTVERGTYSLGRSAGANLQLPASWKNISGIQLRLEIRDLDTIYICDGSPDKNSTNGTQLNNAYISQTEWSLWPQDSELQVGSDLKTAVHFEWSNEISSSTISNRTPDLITVGRSESCTICIDGPTISRVHFTVKNVNGIDVIEDKSTNGVFVNDSRVNSSYPLRDGDQIKAGTHVFAWIDRQLLKETSGKNYRIDVRDLWLPGRISGSSLSIEPGQLVAFVGGSGAGKSSLLTTIVGQNMDYEGGIYINGSELKECYSAIKQEIGFVPQDDIVHRDLTVEEVLRYSAKLKLPDIEQQRKGVEKVLEELEMTHRRHARVKDLSGGQRKRVSIGVELIADPRILFLDEPTSGLDPGLDKRMMQLLRRLADNGKTVALVTHATNNVMICDQVVFLGRGGYLCYAGKPQLCSEYFGVNNDFSDIYQYLELDNDAISNLASKFRAIQRDTLHPINTNNHKTIPLITPNVATRIKGLPVQLITLISRDIKLQLRDVTSLVLNAVTAPLATIMIAIAANNRDIFSDQSSLTSSEYPDALRILFVVICSTIWVGLSTSLQTIVKERPIFVRERAFNLLPEAYLFSKTVVMLVQCLIQSLLVSASVILLFEAPNNVDNWFLSLVLILFSTLIAIGSQALFVSSVVRNSQQASSIAPLLLIPQLVFGGVLFLLSDASEYIYTLISSRWSMRAIGSVSKIVDLIPGGEAGIALVPGAESYEPISSTLYESLEVLFVQAVLLLAATLISLLFYKRNR